MFRPVRVTKNAQTLRVLERLGGKLSVFLTRVG